MQHLQPNSTLQGGKYRIEKVLGQGGFGITYLASQSVSIEGPLGKINAEIKVTIKEFFMKDLCNRDETTSVVSVPSTGSAELVESFRQKFIKEAQNISRLNHPNIIKVLEVFEENGTAYYVMEYIDGGSLNSLIKNKEKLDERETLVIAKKVAATLQYIHNRNMNHLDVKPANILLRKNGDIVLIDFGLAKNYDTNGEQTTSTPMGISIGYAPLEQSRIGGVGVFSPATDIYSLGATMFKMLTGKVPPEASAVMDDGLPELPSNISIRVKQCIEKSMQPRRRDRFQSVEEFLNSLPQQHENEQLNNYEFTEFANDFTTDSTSAEINKSAIYQSDEFYKNQSQNDDEDKEEEYTVILMDSTIHNYSEEDNSNCNYVDLGLSVKWCTKNIGSSSSEDYGGYFAWGDPLGSIQKNIINKFLGSICKIPLNITNSEYDICRTLGTGYRMPTHKEWKELITRCNWVRAQHNGISGFEVTGPSGRKLFLPAAGRKHAGNIADKGIRGSYWSASRKAGSEYVYHFYFEPKEIGLFCNPYYQYRSVRAVYEG